jgi:hypothetical protein
MVATQEKKQKTCPRETYQQFSAAKFGSGSTATVQSYQKDDALKKELREKFHAACDSFGFDKVEAPYDATAALFADNKTLAELYNVRPKGAGSAKSGASSTAHRSGVTYDEGLACAAMVAHFKVSDALEIGLAYGHSALFTACALPADGTLVAVDPAQAMGADEGGWEDKGAQVHPPPPQPAPPPPPFVITRIAHPQFLLSSPSASHPHPAPRTPHPAPRTPHPAPRTPHPATLAFPSPQVVRDCKLPHGGHAKFTCLYEKDTVALPRLVEQGKRIQFCFIDGLHTFDYTMLDAFYADQVGPNPLPSPPYPSTHSHPHPHLYTPTLTLTLTLNSTLALTLLLPPPPPSPQMLDVGGVLAFDDIGYPPVQKATLPF